MKKIVTKLIALCMCMVLVLNFGTETLAASKTKVTLNKKKVILYVGDSKTLKVKGTSKKVKWSSSKKSIVSVSSKGKVTAKKAGKATVNAKVSGKSYKCKVTVKNPYLNKKKLLLSEGENYILKITGTKANSWGSSNKNIATVTSKGQVVAKKKGNTVITCKAKNGKKYKCKVTVVKKIIIPTKEPTEIPVPTITLNPTAKPTSIPITPDKPVITEGVTIIPSATPTITHIHNYFSEVTREATCSECGEKTLTCACGESYKEAISAIGHDYGEVKVVEPTCKEKGYTIKKCNRCEKIIYDNYTELASHDYKEVVTKEPTCTKVGVKTYICKKCGEKKEKAIPAIGHDYEEKVTVKATCMEEGKKSGICKVCGESYEAVVAALGHDYEEVKVVEPTCKEKGYTLKKCKRCDKTVYDEYTEIISHDYEEVITKEPTCLETGIKTCTCKICGEIYKETLAALGHDYEEVKVVEPTCKEKGYTLKKCKHCDKTLYDEYTEIIPHNYDEGKITIEASCETDGIKSFTCKTCGTIKKEIIDATGHNYVIEKNEATATTSGCTVHTCSNCKKSYKDELTEALELKNWKYTVDEKEKTITLESYISDSDSTVIYPDYEIAGEKYNTIIESSLFSGNEKIQEVCVKGGKGASYLTFLFYGCTNLTTVDLSGMDTSKVTNMNSMFENCTSLENIDLKNLNISNVRTMSCMFDGCTNLKTIELFENPTISKLKYVDSMFCNCTNLEEVIFKHGEGPSAITSMYNMFEGCTNLKNADIYWLNGSNVTNCNRMFYGCNKLEAVRIHGNLISKIKYNVENIVYTSDTEYIDYFYMFKNSSYTLDMLLKNN